MPCAGAEEAAPRTAEAATPRSPIEATRPRRGEPTWFVIDRPEVPTIAVGPCRCPRELNPLGPPLRTAVLVGCPITAAPPAAVLGIIVK